MKIKSIELENNEILGDLFLDFTDENGQTFDTVILAGENGTGKSTIFNMIYEFSNYNIINKESNEIRKFKVELNDEEIRFLNNNENFKNQLRNRFFNNQLSNNELMFEFNLNITRSWNQVKVKIIDEQGQKKEVNGNYFSHQEIKPIFRSIFSDVEINFNANNVNSVTSMDIDNEVIASVKSNSNLATQITQLLIDVQALDDSEISKSARNNPDKPVNWDELNLRMSRFERAFNFMFPNKRYKEVRNQNNNKKTIIFEEFGKEVSLDDLSSGEKQIVFRGSFLLKDKNSNKNNIVLIDEPEISLHPNWQLKSLEFYKRLFTDDKGEQTSQMFVATHSPFIIHNKNRVNDKVIILKKDDNGEVYIPDDSKFYGWKPETKIKEAFSINMKFDFDKPIVFVEGETDEIYLNKAIELLNSDIDIKVEWIGRFNNQGNVEFTGDSALNDTKSFIISNPSVLNQKTILLYDSDTNKPEEDYDNLFIRCMPKNNENNIYKKGIENLLSLPENFPQNRFYYYKTNKEYKNDYGGEVLIKKQELNKKDLCEWICNEISIEEKKFYFNKFEKIINIIENIINKS